MDESINTLDVSDTFQYISGTFGNSAATNFVGDVDGSGNPVIKYTGLETKNFEIDWQCTASINGNSRSLHLTSAKNDITQELFGMCAFMKTADESVNVSGTMVLELKTNDNIQLRFKCDTAGDKVNFLHYTTTIREF